MLLDMLLIGVNYNNNIYIGSFILFKCSFKHFVSNKSL